MAQVVQNLRTPVLRDQERTSVFAAYDGTVADHTRPPGQAAVLPGTPAFGAVLDAASGHEFGDVLDTASEHESEPASADNVPAPDPARPMPVEPGGTCDVGAQVANKHTTAGDLPMTDVPNPSGALLGNADDVSIIDSCVCARRCVWYASCSPVYAYGRGFLHQACCERRWYLRQQGFYGCCREVCDVHAESAPATNRAAGRAVQAAPCCS